jgi:hypothetical protein
VGGLGVRGDDRERDQPLRAMRAIDEPGWDLPGAVPVAQGGTGRAGAGGRPVPGSDPPGTIRGDLPVASSLGKVWQALRDSLEDIRRSATAAGLADPPKQSNDEPA